MASRILRIVYHSLRPDETTAWGKCVGPQLKPRVEAGFLRKPAPTRGKQKSICAANGSTTSWVCAGLRSKPGTMQDLNCGPVSLLTVVACQAASAMNFVRDAFFWHNYELVKIKILALFECQTRRDARAAEWGGLENRYTGNCIEGSNPSLSACSLINFPS